MAAAPLLKGLRQGLQNQIAQPATKEPANVQVGFNEVMSFYRYQQPRQALFRKESIQVDAYGRHSVVGLLLAIPL